MARPDALFDAALGSLRAAEAALPRVRICPFQCGTLVARLQALEGPLCGARARIGAQPQASTRTRRAVNAALTAAVQTQQLVQQCTRRQWLAPARGFAALSKQFCDAHAALAATIDELQLDAPAFVSRELCALEERLDRALDREHLAGKLRAMRLMVLRLPLGGVDALNPAEVAEAAARVSSAEAALREAPGAPRDEGLHREIPKADVEVRAALGGGALGLTYVADWQGAQVAVTVLRRQSLSRRAWRVFRKEAALLQSLRHPRLLRALGACTRTPGALCVFHELCAGGSLAALLADRRALLPLPTRVALAADVADGLLYLHDRGWVHGALKPTNVLVGRDLGLKLSGHGLLRTRRELQGFAQDAHRRAAPWTAPEVVEDWVVGAPARLSPAADVYAWGVLAWQLLGSGQPPWQGLDFDDIVERVVLEREVLSLSALQAGGGVPAGLVLAVARCFGPVEARPEAFELVQVVRDALDEVGGDPRVVPGGSVVVRS